MNKTLFELIIMMMMIMNEEIFVDWYLGYLISLLCFAHHDHRNNDRDHYHLNEKQLFVK